MTFPRSSELFVLSTLILILSCLSDLSCSPSRYLAGGSVTVESVHNVDNRGTSSIIGVVYDSTGFDMGGTNIELIDVATQASVKQAVVLRANTFAINDIHPGRYILVANFVGFSKAKSAVLDLKANTTIVVDIYLDPSPIKAIE